MAQLRAAEGQSHRGGTALKDEPGGHIALSGSVSVVRQLLAAALLDELELFIDPIVLHQGMRLFGDGETRTPLRLASSETFATGGVHLVYTPRMTRPPRGRNGCSYGAYIGPGSS